MPETQESRVWSLGGEDPLEEGTAAHSSILSWRVPWTEEPGGLQSMGSHRVRHDGGTKQSTQHSIGHISAFMVSQVDQFMSLPGKVKLLSTHKPLRDSGVKVSKYSHSLALRDDS